MMPPDGLAAIKACFGDPTLPGFERDCIVSFDLPYPLVYGTAMVVRSRAHRLMVPVFRAVLADLKHEGLSDRASHYGGIYAHRPIRGGTRLSTHSWGIAIDINPQENLLGTDGHMDPRVVAVFARHGFQHGLEFERKDPMHFQFCRGY